ncbi:MAG: aspartyl beta-hydroxylase [Acidobacteria bacterium]|nr:MAG: aspartyl beta-hydroxylase [Acidobacteriota bacterium]
MTRITKPDYVRELCAVDIDAIKKLVTRTSDHVWNVEDSRKENNFECFHDTRHIIFRFIEGMRDHREFYSNDIWLIWKSYLLPLISEIVVHYEFELPVYPKIMLARLAAGAVIDRHTDGAGSNLFTHKIHVPLQTNERALMFIRDQPFQLKEGHAYELNNLVPHGAENLGTEDRIHLIFEVFDQRKQATL